MFSIPDQRHQEGQGLVEYGLVLVLVSIAAVAVMNVTGVSIRDSFTAVTDALTFENNAAANNAPLCNDPTDAACGFTACAQDGGFCNVSGTNTIKYGTNDTYATVVIDGSFTCLPEGWTADPHVPVPDPVPGFVKTCYYRSA